MVVIPPGRPFSVQRSAPVRADARGPGRSWQATATTNGENFTVDIAVFVGRADGTFNEAVLLPTDFGSNAIVIDDFNADGRADLIIGHCCGAVETTFALGNGDGTFQPEVPFQAGGNVVALASHDFNADGRPDLAVRLRECCA